MNLTPIQLLGIAIIVFGVLSTSSAQLTDLFGAHSAKLLVSAASLTSTILGGIVGFLGGQGSQIRAVQSMPGVDKIVVNAKANETLATLAVDPTQPKIEAAPGAEKAIQTTAKGT